MIVEDEAIVGEELKISLEDMGYTVTSINKSGEQAIEKADQDCPDLILMDIRLKGRMDGIEAAERIRSRLEIPVVFLTAYADDDKLERAKLTMPFGYILKPFQDRDLEVTIEIALYTAKIDVKRKQAEEELIKTKARLEHLLNASPAVIYSSKASGDFGATFVSENIETQLGYKPQEFTENSEYWASRIHPDDIQRVFSDMSHLLEKGHNIHEYRFLDKEDNYRWIRDELRLVRDKEGEPLEIVGCWIDITEQKLAEETSKKAAAFETLNVVLKNFIGDALSNIINLIYGRIQLSGVRDNIDEIKSDLEDAESGLIDLLTGINAYRKYYGFGKHPMDGKSYTDISHILSRLLSEQALETYGKDKFPIDPNVKLQFTYDPKQKEALDLKELPYVVGPESEIATVIQETLINAVESYDPEKGGDVVISAKKEKDNLILEIADQGRGMNTEDVHKSQLPFFKVLGVKGSARFGLGAYIASESAKHCGGDIQIESREGVGTTASILLKTSDQVF